MTSKKPLPGTISTFGQNRFIAVVNEATSGRHFVEYYISINHADADAEEEREWTFDEQEYELEKVAVTLV